MSTMEIGRRFLAGCAIVAIQASLVACSHPTGSDEEGTAANPETVVAEVTVTRVARGEVSETLTVSGTVAALPNQDVRVSSLVPGRIAQILVGEGDHVAKGQLLAEIEDRPFRDQLQQAEAAVEQANANLENARLTLARNQTLYGRGIAARKDLEDARTQQSVAQAALRQAEAALALAQLQLARTRAQSPLDGIVVKRLASRGEQVDGTAAQPIFEVAGINPVELLGNVPAIYLGQIHIGQTFAISTEAYPGRSFTGRVVAISPAVDPATNLGLVRIRIPNPNGLLRLGVYLTAQLPLVTHSNALIVPPDAIYRDAQGQPVVYRVAGETATAVPVKLGIETHERVELLSGAQAGDTIILTGGYGLGPSAKIRVKP